jgi:hypothetical protein
MAVTEAIIANKIQVALAGLVVLGGGGATYAAMGGDLPFLSGASDMIDTVPAEVDAVASVNAGITEDQATNDLVDGMTSVLESQYPWYDGPPDTESMLEAAGTRSDLDPEAVNSMVMYSSYPDSGGVGTVAGTEYVGVLVDADWTEAALVESLRNHSEYSEESYEGYTVYVSASADASSGFGATAPGPTHVAVLADGEFVLGSEAAVQDAIDVDRGSSPAFGGELRSAYDATRDGSDTYLQYAFRVGSQSSADAETTPTQPTAGPAASLNVVAGSYYTTSDRIGTTLRLHATSGAAAEDLQKAMDGYTSMAEATLDVEGISSILSKTEIQQQGSEVVVTFESDVSALVEDFESIVEHSDELFSMFSGGFSGSASASAGASAAVGGGYGTVAGPSAVAP